MPLAQLVKESPPGYIRQEEVQLMYEIKKIDKADKIMES